MELPFFATWHRFGLRAFRYLRWRDVWHGLTIVVAGYLVATMYLRFTHPRPALIAGAIYAFLVIVDGVDMVRGRKARDYAKAEILKTIFSRMNDEVYAGDVDTRFTLFLQSPLSSDYIVPWYRYRKGDEDLIVAANSSRAFYRKGEGFTGYAWANAGTELIWANLPVFQDRAELDRYYTSALNVTPGSVGRISDEMLNVRCILSYGLTDSDNKFLGVLSVDLPYPLEVTDDDPYPRHRGEYLYADTMAQNVFTLTMVLESMARAEKKSRILWRHLFKRL